jgi:hypothetical protein
MHKDRYRFNIFVNVTDMPSNSDTSCDTNMKITQEFRADVQLTAELLSKLLLRVNDALSAFKDEDLAQEEWNAMYEQYKTFAEESKPKTAAEWVAIAEKISIQNKCEEGKLPTIQQLKKLGMNGLSVAMRKNPKLFQHISRT